MIRNWFGKNRRIAEQALRCAQQAAEVAGSLNRAVEQALELVDRQARELEGVRSELAAYRVGTMEEDAQTAELERMINLPSDSTKVDP